MSAGLLLTRYHSPTIGPLRLRGQLLVFHFVSVSWRCAILVLSRTFGEQVVLTVPPSDQPTRIIVMLTDIRSGNKARIGFEAPDNVSINRAEIQERVDLETVAAD